MLCGLAVSPGKPRVPHCDERPGAAHSGRDPVLVAGWRRAFEKLVAIHDTIKRLSNVDAFQLFKASRARRCWRKERSMNFAGHFQDRRGWGPLKAEQVDEDDKQAYCVQSFDKTEDEAKVLAHQFVDHKVTEDCEEQLSNADDRIAVVQKSISQFHASAAKAFGIKQTQHSDFVTLTPTMQPRRSLKLTINRLNKFYVPKLGQASTKGRSCAVVAS